MAVRTGHAARWTHYCTVPTMQTDALKLLETIFSVPLMSASKIRMCTGMKRGNSQEIAGFLTGAMPCSSDMTSQNLAPIWLPHWPP